MQDKLNKLESNYDNILREAEQVAETISRISNNYKDVATKNDMNKFKDVILKALNEVKGDKTNHISIIRIGCGDRVGSISEFKKLIVDTLELEIQEGNFKDWSLYKEEVWITFYDDTIEFYKMINKEDDSLLIEIKDKVLNRLIAEFNARKICLYTKLEDGYQNWEFFECDRFVEPKKNWLDKFMDFCGA